MTSESFGCHDISRHRWGASARWQNCCFSLSEGCPGHCGGLRRRLDALHEGGVLLDEGRVHFGWVGPSCSTHNPWPVDPDPRGAGRPEARLTAEPASNHDHRAPAQTAGRGRWGRTCDGGAGPCRKPHGLSLLRGLVSTALTLAGPTSVRPAGIVGILRFLSGVPRRCACDVSTMDTGKPSSLFPRLIVAPRTTSTIPESCLSECLRSHDTRCLTSEKPAQHPKIRLGALQCERASVYGTPGLRSPR